MIVEELVSVIIPTFNRLNELKRAVASVCKQTYQNWELIIVDDGSFDGTKDWLQEFENQQEIAKLKVITTQNNGVSCARNRGVNESRGSWIAFLDSDDEWLPPKLQWQLELAYNEKRPLIHGEEIWIRNGKRVNPAKKHAKSGGDVFFDCLKLCCISPSASMIKKDIFLDLGGFDEKMSVCEDYDLWLQLASRYSVSFEKRPIIVKYGGHSDQLSARFKAMDHWRVYSLLKLLSLKLEPLQTQAILDELFLKLDVLKKGYLKHQHFDRLKLIEHSLSFLEKKNLNELTLLRYQFEQCWPEDLEH